MLNKLKLGFGRKLPLLLQNEAAECGLACLGMVSGFYGHRFDMLTLRRRFATTLKGATLEQLMNMAGRLQLASRPLRLDLHELRELRLPCVLHWNLNHFVVLQAVGRQHIVIVLTPPADGARCRWPRYRARLAVLPWNCGRWRILRRRTRRAPCR